MIHNKSVEHYRTVQQEKPHLVLYYTKQCPYSQKVLRYLKQVHKKVDLVNVENNPQGKLTLKNQGGKMQVPCLFIDGKPLYESDEIITWLSNHLDQLDTE
ncbi:MAG: glutaredoxin [Verrucomicrobia bacterium]|nr:glutaredoxin [Verrucomicrobiota bacterium]